MRKPPWFEWAENEIGQHEQPENRGPVVERYISLAKCGVIGDPWCAIFVNAALEAQGLHGTRSPSSQSFRHSNHFIPLSGPAKGAVTVFWRQHRTSGFGHVGFYDSETAGYINVLGGNESDAVRKELYVKRGSQFGLIGFWWPASYPKPTIEAIPHYLSQLPRTTK